MVEGLELFVFLWELLSLGHHKDLLKFERRRLCLQTIQIKVVYVFVRFLSLSLSLRLPDCIAHSNMHLHSAYQFPFPNSTASLLPISPLSLFSRTGVLYSVGVLESHCN